jgi:hypothetical protein
MDEDQRFPPDDKERRKDERRRNIELVRDHGEARKDPGEALTPEDISRSLQRERERHLSRKRWGTGLVILGFITMLDACSFIPIPLVGAAAIWAGVFLMVLGAVLHFSVPKMKATNEALAVAARNGNRLTTARLALEMDITLKKADKIIHELMERGVAEIDLEANEAGDGIVYRIRGL